MSDDIGSAGAAGNPAGESAAAGSVGAPFYDSFQNPDLKAWAANKGFENPEVAMRSYQNLEKLMGHDRAGRTVVVPGDDAAPEERAAFMAKLGRPDKPDGYEMPTDGDAEFSSWAKNVFHEIGLPAKQAKALVEKWGEYMGQRGEAMKQEGMGRITTETDKLRKEWGAAFEDKVKIVDRAAAQFGLDSESLTKLRDSWGPYKAMTFFEKIGSSLGNSEYISGDGAKSFNGAMTPAQATGRIKELRGDQGFVARYVSGDANARAEMERLHKYAYPEG